MTRGQIAIITPEGNILSSREFNGDMYLSNGGYGEEVFGDLALADTVEDYISIVEQFNDRYFGYKEELFYNPPKSFLDMKHDYFDKWFSDLLTKKDGIFESIPTPLPYFIMASFMFQMKKILRNWLLWTI